MLKVRYVRIGSRLKAQPVKNNFIWLGTRQQLAMLNLAAIAMDNPISLFFVVGDVGVILDCKFTAFYRD